MSRPSGLNSQYSKNVRLNTLNASWSKLLLLFSLLPKLVSSVPIAVLHSLQDDQPVSIEDMTPMRFYTYLIASACLVCMGGIFAGLTLALMGQDEIYLKVIANSGTVRERYFARKVLNLVGKGKHWVLVTLLLSNVITNETLPVVLDRCLGGGLIAVFSSTISIVIFGEIIPQSVCVRYGLQIGAYFAPFVLFLMYMLYPIAYPIALLLDYTLGENHGTMYKRSGLKTLVTLHRTMGVERLNQDEVTIISAVLDLKEKSVGSIMTPIDKVFTMSADTILNETTVDEIFNSGFSRIPIHLPNEPKNFIGMLLVRVLISYDPEDALPVASFPLATLPETSEDTSCLNILNYFQEGKSHMVIVSETPGMATGAKGVLTLEDVIEELIGEEIVDESDVYIDLNKSIKRNDPGPLAKRNFSGYLHTLYGSAHAHSAKPASHSFPVNVAPISRINPSLSVPSNGQWNGNGAAGTGSSKNNNVAYYHKTAVPSNLAAKPLDTNRSYVTIKKQNEDTMSKLKANSKLWSPEIEIEGDGHKDDHKDDHRDGDKDEHKEASDDNKNSKDDNNHPVDRSLSKSPGYGSTTNDKKFLLPNEREHERDITTISVDGEDGEDVYDFHRFDNKDQNAYLMSDRSKLVVDTPTIGPSSYKLINHNHKTIICAIDDEDETAHNAHAKGNTVRDRYGDTSDEDGSIEDPFANNLTSNSSRSRKDSFIDYIKGK
ncbi:hypothetical protein PACTADRAFT_50171 [Pachysolen tannophilus NRRL Y-2460]|uniref:CNNM transmembrane domain-containing protein n=1 Tax=Pachysolen tannophilus NRRL Y-2460 TaxID=669874 RepID=A0A1E4TUM6_PACTA|nr:hypothetical protein PACTADRAFT_50171 [Pachysolen tannophilus NRRL Y-2460]